MEINQAVKHLTWRLQQNRINPNEKDIEAFNCILNTLNKNYDESLIQDVLFAKLLIERLMLLTMDGKRSMQNAIGVMKESLETPLLSWLKYFQSQVPMIRLMRAFEVEFIKLELGPDDMKNALKVREAKLKLISENQKKLVDEFTKPYTEEELHSFIKRLVFELKKEFQNKP